MNFLNWNFLSSLLKAGRAVLFSKKALAGGLLICLSVYVHFIFLLQPLKGKKWLSAIYKKPVKRTLQRVDGPLIKNDMNVRVLKVKQKNKIYLEFLSKQANGSYLVINLVELKGGREAYFEFWKKEREWASLLLMDDNGDGTLDVIAPTFDKFFRPQINVAIYNQKTGQFELSSPLSSPEIISPLF